MGATWPCPIPTVRYYCSETGILPIAALEYVALEEHHDQFINPGQIFGYIGEERGIQGHQNSCYLDSTVFGLFAASDVFDSMFLEQDQGDPAGGEVKHLLWKGIVNPLRKYADMSHASIHAHVLLSKLHVGLYTGHALYLLCVV